MNNFTISNNLSIELFTISGTCCDKLQQCPTRMFCEKLYSIEKQPFAERKNFFCRKIEIIHA